MLNIRKFPIILGIAAAVFLFFIGLFKKDIILTSLAELALTISVFLVFFAAFNEINKIKINPDKIKELINKFNFKKTESRKNDADEIITRGAEDSNGLMEIQKETTLDIEKTKEPFLRKHEIVFIILFLGLAFWRALRMFSVFPSSFSNLNYSIADAVLLAAFPFIILIYLKIKKDSGESPFDKISSGLLALLSYTLLIFAAVIAVSSALTLNIIAVLKWIYYAVTLFIPLYLAYNVIFFILKKEKLNISLKSLYTIKYTVKILPAVILGLGFVLFLSTSVFVVQPHQQALVFRFGKLVNSSAAEEGLHFKFPFPFERADIYDAHRLNSMQIWYRSSYSANYLWTRSHDGGENTLLLGNGNEMVAVNMKLIYKISGLYDYVKTSSNPEETLRAAFYEALMRRTVDTTLDEFLSVDRSSLSSSLSQELSDFCRSEKLGLSVLQVIIESIHPPVDIADIYQRVVTAIVIKNTITTRARTEAERRIIASQQEARTVIDNAAANLHNRVSEAQKETAVFFAAMQAHSVNPRSFELVKYLDTYEKIIGGNKVYVFSPRMEEGITKAVIGKTNIIGINYE